MLPPATTNLHVEDSLFDLLAAAHDTPNAPPTLSIRALTHARTHIFCLLVLSSAKPPLPPCQTFPSLFLLHPSTHLAPTPLVFPTFLSLPCFLRSISPFHLASLPNDHATSSVLVEGWLDDSSSIRVLALILSALFLAFSLHPPKQSLDKPRMPPPPAPLSSRLSVSARVVPSTFPTARSAAILPRARARAAA